MCIPSRRLSAYIFTSAVFFLLISCNGENLDTAVERSCLEADGLWTVVSASCDGEVVSNINPVTFLFEQESGVLSQTEGRVDCATHFDWSVELGEQTPLFSMTGMGNLTCTASGEDVSFCSSDVNACNAGIDITGIRNEYPTCVVTTEGMSLMRTVSVVNNPDNLSYCDDGQSEVVILHQGDYTPPVPKPEPEELIAYLEVLGPNPLDFGTHPVGARVKNTITINNTGNAEATSLNGDGITSPFMFSGSIFPGIEGTCGETLAAGSSCTVSIEFFSQVPNYYTDSLVLSYNNGRQTISIDHGLAATSSNSLAQVSISNGPYYNFGVLEVGATAANSFTVTNSGGGDAIAMNAATLEAPFGFLGGAYPGTGGDCGSIVLAGQSCQIVVEFAPDSEGGFNSSIVLDYIDGVNSQQARRNIFGQGTAATP